MNAYNIDLDLDKRYSGQIVTIRQGDHNGTSITATLYKGDERFTTSGLTAYFAMRLPGGKDYYRKSATYNNGVVSVTIDEEYAGSTPGRSGVAYFELHQGSSVIASTSDMMVIVLPNATAGMAEGQRYDDEIVAAIRAWLVEHPEATTTVQDDAITTQKLKDSSITTAKLADGSVTTPKLADSSVTTAKVSDAAVTADKLAANSVTSQKIADGSVTIDKIEGMSKLTNAQISAMF